MATMHDRCPTPSAIAALILAAVALTAGPHQVLAQPSTSLDALSDAFETLAEQASPAVVQIFAVGFAPGRQLLTSGDLLAKQRGSGSGVILDADGTIVTNAHVVAGARKVQVLLARPPAGVPEGSSILRSRGEVLGAQVVGIDRETDLAVLRVQAKGLPHLELGDSDELRQGQLVIALGSPLGLENSVSMGVVSSVARQLGPEDPMIYIQTDAPINPGNSGGPLLDTSGRVMGINTAIFSQSGGNEGIGFAAPSNIVRAIYEQIRSTGRVRRSEIGVHAQTITPELAEGLRLPRQWGVVLADVYPGGPAHKEGLKIGDVVLTLDGKPMENGRQLDVNVYRRKPDERVTLEVLRGTAERHQQLTFRVAVRERSDDPDRFADLATPEKNLIRELGILGIEMDSSIARMMPGLRREAGVLVAAIAADAPFWEGGFRPGDVIHGLNGQEITELGRLRTALARLQVGDSVVIQIERGGQYQYLAFELE
jgi:serine protease Do